MKDLPALREVLGKQKEGVSINMPSFYNYAVLSSFLGKSDLHFPSTSPLEKQKKQQISYFFSKKFDHNKGINHRKKAFFFAFF